MLFKYYFSLWLITIVGFCHSFKFFSVGDPGLPRWIKSCAFGISFMNFFFDNEKYYHCVFILIFIGDQAI